MTYQQQLNCPTCGTAIPNQDITGARVECRSCRREYNLYDL